jgi:hypothetical protein
MRFRLPRASEPDPSLDSRIASIEAELAELRLTNTVLWALAPQWITSCLPHAIASGWTVESSPAAIIFRHAGRDEEFGIPLPLPDPAGQVTIQRELHMRLPFVGQTGLPKVKPHRGTLVRDLRE